MQQWRRKPMGGRLRRISELLEQRHADMQDLECAGVDEEEFGVDVGECRGVWLARPLESPDRYPNIRKSVVGDEGGSKGKGEAHFR
jgi:hypothetical protein